MKNLATYCQDLEFEYAISYSGLRGDKYKEYTSSIRDQIESAKDQKNQARFMEKAKLSKTIEDLEKELRLIPPSIVSEKGELHQTTELVHTFKKSDEKLKRIFDILKIEFAEQSAWMCAPIYRDAIVFYNSDNTIVEILHMCFSCGHMKTAKEESLEVDNIIFEKLQSELIQIGHKIGSEDERRASR